MKTSLRNFFQNKEVKTSYVLDYIFPLERRIRSLIGGLETSIGTTFWELIAKILAEANGFKIIEEKILNPDPFPQELRQELDRLINERETKKISTEYCI